MSDLYDVDVFMAALERVANPNCLAIISSAEDFFRANAAKFKGFVAASNAFRSHLVSTVSTLNGTWRPYSAAVSPTHTWLLLRVADNFHWLCAAMIA